MKLSSRSYPHPVLGNRDDVPGAAFQATMEMVADKEAVYIDTTINCSSTTIDALLADQAAQFVLHVECSNTFFRQAFAFSERQKRISIPADKLNDTVEVNAFVIAIRPVSSYQVEGAHSDYGATAFDIRTGDILAVAEGHSFYIESNFDSLKRIGSIMQVEEANEEGDLPMRVDYNGSKILIILSKSDCAAYRLLKAHETAAAPITCTIVLPVLMEALHVLRENWDSVEESSQRWMRCLKKRILTLDCESERDNLLLAQRLLEMPIRRALNASKQLAEAVS